MVILGIDPGTAVTGYGVIRTTDNRAAWVDSGVIATDSDVDLSSRLATIYDGLCKIIEQHHPGLVCVEEAFYAKNVHTTLLLGHARGVAMLAANKAGAAVDEFSPREIKKSLVGNGNATKDQVAYMVKFMLSPPVKHSQSDAYDALAVALTGFMNLSRRRIESFRRA
jgi:crossover junction endodeoxyribonuclease RuvC